MKDGLCVELTPTLVTEELSAERSTAGVGTTLCRRCLGDDDDDDATMRALRAPTRVVRGPAVGA